MSRKPYKHAKKGAGRHVQLPEWLQASEAWGTMQPGPRALYIELKRRFSGGNNGEIYLSHRDAAKLLNVHRNTVGPWFNELQERGFIHLNTAPPPWTIGRRKGIQMAIRGNPDTGWKASDEGVYAVV